MVTHNKTFCIISRITPTNGPFYTKRFYTLRQLYDHASDTVLIENNGDAQNGLQSLFWGDSIVFN